MKKPGSRRLLSAVRAAGRMRMTGAQWHLLLTAPREALGSARSQRARALYEALERVVAQLVAPAGQEVSGRPETPAGEPAAAGRFVPAAGEEVVPARSGERDVEAAAVAVPSG